MESLNSKIVKVLLRMIGYKRPMELSGSALRKSVEKKRKKESHEVPEKIKRKFEISKKDVNGFCCYVMKPLNNAGSKHILFIHGGGFVYEITGLHWTFLCKLANSFQCTVTIPIYPLAPEHICDEAYDMVLSVYSQIVSNVLPADLTIMGDSAGGGMALSLAQHLKEKGLPQPGNIILLSPTLDMTMTNQEIPEIEKKDPLLAVPAIVEFSNWFRGNKEMQNYMISPMFGSLEGLGRISIFIGTRDLLYPDARKFKNMLDNKGIYYKYFEYPEMIHDWILLPFPESKRALKQIIDTIK